MNAEGLSACRVAEDIGSPGVAMGHMLGGWGASMPAFGGPASWTVFWN